MGIKLSMRNYKHSDPSCPTDIIVYKDKPVCAVTLLLNARGRVRCSTLVKKSGEEVHFFTDSLPFTSMKYGHNILVNKSGEKVNFFCASLSFISV